MKPKITQGIVLKRINYSEADRILTIITKDFGKVSLIAKGVRKEKSKLAGGIELFSVNEVGYLESRGELVVLTNSRLVRHYGNFLDSLEKVNFAYSCLKKIDKITENNYADEEYFLLLQQLLRELNDSNTPLNIIELWWYVKLTDLMGHSINTERPIGEKEFSETQKYIFIDSKGGFKPDQAGNYSPEHIKLIKIIKNHLPSKVLNVKNIDKLSINIIPLAKNFSDYVH